MSRRPSHFVIRKEIFMDIISIIIMFYFIDFSFYPLESYLSGGESDVSLPLPVTTLSLVIVTVLIFIYFLRGGRRVKVSRGAILLYIVIFFAFLSASWADEPSQTVKRALRYLPTVMLGVIFAQYYTVRKATRLMLIAFFLTASFGIVISVAVPSLGISRIGGAYEYAWRGLQVHKNFTGDIMATGILMVFGAWITKNISLRSAGIVATPIALLLVMSSSGTAMMGAAAAISFTCILFVVRKMPLNIRPLLLVAALSLMTAAMIALYLNLDLLFAGAGRDMTFTGRTYIWDAVWQKIWLHPIRGFGYGMWSAVDDRTKLWIQMMVGDTAAHSHNTWLDIWLQLGLVPLCILIYCCLYLLFASIYRLVWLGESEAAIYVLVATYIWARSFLEIQFTDPWTAEMFWLSWGLTRLKVRGVEAAQARKLAHVKLRTRPEVKARQADGLHLDYGKAHAQLRKENTT